MFEVFFFYFRTGWSKNWRGHAPSLKSGGATGPSVPPPMGTSPLSHPLMGASATWHWRATGKLPQPCPHPTMRPGYAPALIAVRLCEGIKYNIAQSIDQHDQWSDTKSTSFYSGYRLLFGLSSADAFRNYLSSVCFSPRATCVGAYTFNLHRAQYKWKVRACTNYCRWQNEIHTKIQKNKSARF